MTGRDTSTLAATDTLTGNDSNNVLKGLAGSDTLNGAGGSDTLIGGMGLDSMTGGSGADFFQFDSAAESFSAGYDNVFDFNRAEGDKIDLRGFANENPNDLTWRDNGAFTAGGDPELRWYAIGAHSVAAADINGDGTEEFSIFMWNQTSMQQSDFLAFFQ